MVTPMAEERWVRTSIAAKRLGIETELLYALIKEGKLAYRRQGRGRGTYWFQRVGSRGLPQEHLPACAHEAGQMTDAIVQASPMVDPRLVQYYAALHYAKNHGLRLLPGEPDKKKPYITSGEGFGMASSDPAQLRAWWKQFPDATILCATGPSKLVVIDADVYKDGGVEAFKTIFTQEHPMPRTPVALTPRGGVQVFFRAPEGVTIRSSQGIAAPTVDIRARGGLVVLPPSQGRKWDGDDYDIDRRKIAPLPPFLVQLLAEKEQKPSPVPVAVPGVIPEGQRHSTMVSLAGSMQRRGMSFDAIFAALKAENAERCRPPLDESELQTIAHSMSRYPPEPERGKTGRPRTVVYSDPNAEMEGVDWIWQGRWARGKLVTVEGEGGCGKSTLTLDTVARLSRGKAPYGNDRKPLRPLRIMIISAEDSWKDTIKPRLVVAEADFANIFHIEGLRNDNEEVEPMDLARDLVVLEQEIVAKRIDVVVVDPLSAFLGKLDANSDTDVRVKLSPLTAMLSRTNAAGVAIRHHSKAGGARAKYRGLHSVAFTNAARVVLTAGEHPTEAGSYCLAWAKGNLAAPCPTLTYRLEEADLGVDAKGNRILPVKVVWTGVSDLTADDITARGEVEGATKLDAAKEFLEGIVSEPLGLEGDFVLREGKKQGHARSTLYTAKRALKIVHKPGGFGGKILWFPPPGLKSKD